MNVEILKSMASRYLGRQVCHAIEFTHSGFSQDWNFINSGATSSITIDGTAYESFPFTMTLVPEGEDAGASIVMANVDRRIAEELSNAVSNEDILVSAYLCHLEKVNGVIVGERYFKGSFSVTSVEVTQEAVSFGVALKTSLGYNASALRFSKTNFGNLYL